MALRKFTNIKTMLMLVLITILMLSSLNESQARKRSGRKYNPKATRAQAIDVIRSSSSKISELAGVEPSFTPDATAVNMNDSEALSDSDEILGDSGENLEELANEDDVVVDMDAIKTLWLQFIDDNLETTAYGIRKQVMMDQIMDWLGTPYRFGAASESAIDCSAWTQKLFAQTANLMLPRTAREQINVGRKIVRKNLEFGDLIFFHTYSRKFASHVGIYLGDNLFAHASSRYGVTISSLESTFYANRFIGGRRISQHDMLQYAIKGKADIDQ